MQVSTWTPVVFKTIVVYIYITDTFSNTSFHRSALPTVRCLLTAACLLNHRQVRGRALTHRWVVLVDKRWLLDISSYLRSLSHTHTESKHTEAAVYTGGFDEIRLGCDWTDRGTKVTSVICNSAVLELQLCVCVSVCVCSALERSWRGEVMVGDRISQCSRSLTHSTELQEEVCLSEGMCVW